MKRVQKERGSPVHQGQNNTFFVHQLISSAPVRFHTWQIHSLDSTDNPLALG